MSSLRVMAALKVALKKRTGAPGSAFANRMAA
jgi:hypothetical protein